MSHKSLSFRTSSCALLLLAGNAVNVLAAPQWPTSTSDSGSGSWPTSGSDSGSDGQWAGGSGGWSGPAPDIPPHYNKVRVAHAVLASTAWLFFFPVGAILIRTLDSGWVYGDVRIHAIVQMAGYCIFIAAAGMGIWMAKTGEVLNYYHPITGMVLLGCVALQPLTEILNARFYSKYPKMIYLAHLHIWFGRILITAGIIQGGMGFIFSASLPYATAPAAPRIAYGVVAVIAWILYVSLAIVWPEVRHTFGWWRRRNSGRGERSTIGLRARSLSEAVAPSAIDRANAGRK